MEPGYATRTTDCWGYLEGASCSGLSVISHGSYCSLILFLRSGVVSLARSFQVIATYPMGGHDSFLFSFSSSLSIFLSQVFIFHKLCMSCLSSEMT